jgi:hypothetical protein
VSTLGRNREPHAPTRDLTPMLAAACAAALALCWPATRVEPSPGFVDDAGPLPVVERGRLSAPAALPCSVQQGAPGSVVHLSNSTEAELPRGSRIAWATTGAPAAQGHWHWLAQPLAPGQGLALPLSTTLNGSGCIATLLR